LHSYTFFFFAGVNCLLVIFVIFFVPETRRVALEEMDALFGGANHVEKGANILHVEDAHHVHIGGDHQEAEVTPTEAAEEIREEKRTV